MADFHFDKPGLAKHVWCEWGIRNASHKGMQGVLEASHAGGPVRVGLRTEAASKAIIGNLRSTTNETTTTSIDRGRTGTTTSVSAGK